MARWYIEAAAERLAKGSVADPKSGCVLWTRYCDRWGYARIRDDAGKKRLAHRVALELHLGRALADDAVVMHSCDTPRCINPLHLREGTVAENNAECMQRGRHSGGRGERHGMAKITREEAAQIRLRFSQEGHARELGAEYGISKTQVLRIVHRKIWRDVA